MLFDRWRAKVVYSDDGLRDKSAGLQYRNTAQIGSEARGDAGLLAHELTHVKQWQICIVAAVVLACALGAWLLWPWGAFLGIMAIRPGEALHGYLYARFVQYRLWAETWAYRVQLRLYPDRTESIAEWMASDASGYRFNITKEEALKKLTG